MMRRYSVRDDRWEKIKHLLPGVRIEPLLQEKTAVIPPKIIGKSCELMT